MQETYEFIKANADRILDKANEGDALSRSLVSMYELHRKCPRDPAAQGLLSATVNDWRESNPT